MQVNKNKGFDLETATWLAETYGVTADTFIRKDSKEGLNAYNYLQPALEYCKKHKYDDGELADLDKCLEWYPVVHFLNTLPWPIVMGDIQKDFWLYGDHSILNDYLLDIVFDKTYLKAHQDRLDDIIAVFGKDHYYCTEAVNLIDILEKVLSNFKYSRNFVSWLDTLKECRVFSLITDALSLQGAKYFFYTTAKEDFAIIEADEVLGETFANRLADVITDFISDDHTSTTFAEDIRLEGIKYIAGVLEELLGTEMPFKDRLAHVLEDCKALTEEVGQAVLFNFDKAEQLMTETGIFPTAFISNVKDKALDVSYFAERINAVRNLDKDSRVPYSLKPYTDVLYDWEKFKELYKRVSNSPIDSSFKVLEDLEEISRL